MSAVDALLAPTHPWAIQLSELDEQRITLTQDESRFLLADHQQHIDLRPILDGAQEWRVRPGAYCGALPLPTGRTIYIEPKVGVENLWRMLAWAYDLLNLADETPVPAGTDDLLEAMVAIFAGQVSDLIRNGLLRGYEPQRENLTTMRGRLNVPCQIRENLVARHRMICDFDEFTTDVLENRILRRTLFLLLRSGPWRDVVRGQLDRAERHVAEAELEHIVDSHFAELRYTRLNEHYRTPLMLAELLLQMLSATHRVGEREMLPLLLHMPKVFERFLQRMLSERLPEHGLSVRWEGESRRLDVGRTVKLVPDMVVCRDRRPVCILDSKYKRTHEQDEEEDRGPGKASNQDIFQMMAYCVAYDVREAILIYPETTVREIIEIRQPGIEVNVRCLGIDLRGDRRRFADVCDALTRDIARVASESVEIGS